VSRLEALFLSGISDFRFLDWIQQECFLKNWPVALNHGNEHDPRANQGDTATVFP
jgi:hypothetical protein